MIESKYLKGNSQNIEKLMVIPGLKKFNTKHLTSLLQQSKIRQYEQGEIIIKEGDTDKWFYFLLSGTVKIVKQGQEISVINKQGEVLGEMSILNSAERSTTVQAEGKAVCLAVDTTASNPLALEEDKRDHLLLMYKIFTDYMSSRLRTRTEELVDLRKENRRLRVEIKTLKKASG